jgi:hypothetical protein
VIKEDGRPGRAARRRGSRLRRFIRGIRPDRNPLRRRSDRIEAYLLAGSLAAAIAAAPFAARLAGEAGHEAAARTQHSQLASRREVRAVLLQSVSGTAAGYSFQTVFPARARWTVPGKGARTGLVGVPAGTPEGTTFDVWINTAGQLTTPPLAATQVAGQADLASAAAVTGIAIVYLCEAVAVRQVLTRRRLAAWDAEWAVTGPAWNRQRW